MSKRPRWWGGPTLVGWTIAGAALALSDADQPVSEATGRPAAPGADSPSRIGISPSGKAQERRPVVPAASTTSSVTISLSGGAVTATTSDPDVEMTAAKGGKLLKISDTKSGQQVTINAQEFSIQQGDGANSLRGAGDTITLYRGTAPLVVIARNRGVTSAVPRSPTPMPGYLNQPPTSPRHLVSGAVSPDGRHVVTAHFDRTIRIWNAAAGNELRTLEPYRDRILGVMFAAEGREIAIVSQDGIRLVDVATVNPLRTIGSSLRKIDLAAISADGRHALSGTATCRMRTCERSAA